MNSNIVILAAANWPIIVKYVKEKKYIQMCQKVHRLYNNVEKNDEKI